MSVETYAKFRCGVSFYPCWLFKQKNTLKLSFNLSLKWADFILKETIWWKKKILFLHMFHSSHCRSGWTRARPCARLLCDCAAFHYWLCVRHVLSCNKASQSNPLIREADTQGSTQRAEGQPFPIRHWGYSRLSMSNMFSKSECTLNI